MGQCKREWAVQEIGTEAPPPMSTRLCAAVGDELLGIVDRADRIDEL